jgi:hypothetical protein
VYFIIFKSILTVFWSILIYNNRIWMYFKVLQRYFKCCSEFERYYFKIMISKFIAPLVINSQNYKFNFTILSTNLAIASTNFTRIMNQLPCVDNWTWKFNQFCYMLRAIRWFGIHIHNFTKSISWTMQLYFMKNSIHVYIFMAPRH